MLVIQDAFNSSDLPRGGIGTIGNFDGVHRGQQTVIETTRKRAAEEGVTSLVITFEPHPIKILRPDEAPLRLTTPEQKEALLREQEIDVLLVVHFTPEFAKTTAEEFVRDFLGGRLGLRELYVGQSFVFGHGRQGDLDLLREVGASCDLQAIGVDEVARRGERISSTRIRRAISEGRVEAAEEMLGRPHTITGVITRGDRMGKRLGWPTINLVADNELLPADGVYATRVHFPHLPATFVSSTNIGTRPTVYENYQRVLESHILDFNTDVYGRRVELSFYKRLREERIFATVMDLSAQIGRDVEATREFFAAREGLANTMEA